MFGYKRMLNLACCSLNDLGFPFLLLSEALFIGKELNWIEEKPASGKQDNIKRRKKTNKVQRLCVHRARERLTSRSHPLAFSDLSKNRNFYKQKEEKR